MLSHDPASSWQPCHGTSMFHSPLPSLRVRSTATTTTEEPRHHFVANHRPISGPSDYIIIRTIRQSIYGKVRLGCLRRRPDIFVALKISALESTESRSTLEDPFQETQIMRALSAHGGHPNVIKLYDDFIQSDDATGFPKYHWQILEFCSNGELFDLIASNKGKCGIGEDLARYYFKQLVSGLKFIHARGVVHLDISPENILLDHINTPKIIDFGMARYLPAGGVFSACAGRKPGKLGYMAPEIFTGLPFDGRAADVYSLGVVLFAMLVGFPPYAQPCEADKRFEAIYSGHLSALAEMWGLTSRISPEAIDLIQAMMCHPSHRITLEQIEAHPWLCPSNRGFSSPISAAAALQGSPNLIYSNALVPRNTIQMVVPS